MQYRLSFVLLLIGMAGVTVLDFIEIGVIFRHIPRLGGWTFAEVAFLYGTTAISFSFCDLIVGHLDELPALVRNGTFDVMLTRPLGSLFQIATVDFALRRLGKTLQGVAVFAYAVAALNIAWDPSRVIVTALTIVTGTLIFMAIWILGAAAVFWLVDAREVINSVTYGGNYLTSHPINIFGIWVRRLMAFVIPLAFVNYYPALYVLGKSDALGMPGFFRFLSPLVAAAAAIVASVAWRFAVRTYRSTGS